MDVQSQIFVLIILIESKKLIHELKILYEKGFVKFIIYFTDMEEIRLWEQWDGYH